MVYFPNKGQEFTCDSDINMVKKTPQRQVILMLKKLLHKHDKGHKHQAKALFFLQLCTSNGNVPFECHVFNQNV